MLTADSRWKRIKGLVFSVGLYFKKISIYLHMKMYQGLKLPNIATNEMTYADS